mgnify:FL=1|tara:strand:+ start:1373 stop:1795 length:423 start_codon:yes stop_codon:yes gene_type:complete
MIKLGRNLFSKNNIIRLAFITIIMGGIFIIIKNLPISEGFIPTKEEDNLLYGKLISEPLSCGGGKHYTRILGTCAETYNLESGNADLLKYCVEEGTPDPNIPSQNTQSSIITQTCNYLQKNLGGNQLDAQTHNKNGTSCL